MAGTISGGNKARDTMRKTLGEEGYRKLLQERGRKGGSRRVKKGFAITGNASEMGRKGRYAPRRSGAGQ